MILRTSRADWRRLAPRLALFVVAAILFTWAFMELTGTKHALQAASVEALVPEFRKHSDFTLVEPSKDPGGCQARPVFKSV